MVFQLLRYTTGSPKKLRPKSLAISTPTKLLSLEEARSRALANASSCQTDNTQDVSILPTNTASNPGGSIPSGLPANISQDQKYIEVGGGPSTLPQKYHTVIEISGTRYEILYLHFTSGKISLFLI